MTAFRSMGGRHSVYCRICIFILASIWIVAIVCGMFYASANREAIGFSILDVSMQSVSPTGLAIILLLPLTVSVIAVSFRFRWILYLVCGAKGFALGYCLFCIQLTFKYAGWLVYPLLLFSDIAMLIPLFWFWIRAITHIDKQPFSDAVVLLLAAAAIGCIDLFFVSPYLISLIQHF